jgi:CubicO group peptidase (beta-lactamase class C family)
VYCQENIFGPLNMTNTSWFVADIDKSQHAIPYAYVADGHIHSPNWGGIDLGLLNGDQPATEFNGPYPDCIYDHPNFADGFLRSSVAQLVNFQIAAIRGEMLNDDQGIIWHRRTLPNGPEVLGHGGGDPGISTSFDFDPASGDGVIIFANIWGVSLDEISTRLFAELKNLFD